MIMNKATKNCSILLCGLAVITCVLLLPAALKPRCAAVGKAMPDDAAPLDRRYSAF